VTSDVTGMQETITPVDGSVYLRRPLATAAEIDQVLDLAVAAQRGWQAAPLGERMAACRALAAELEADAEAIGEELSWQMGRPVSQAPGEISRGFAERAAFMVHAAPDALADLAVAEPAPGSRRFIRRGPLGTVLVLAPWNYPYLCSVNAIIPALVAGNTVVLKVASQTPLVAERYAAAAEAAGLPAGVFGFVHADHASVAKMVGDRRVDFVAFTGSVEGGHAVQRAAAERFVGVGLELGGKDPAYVRADAPVAATAEAVADGVFFNAGQSCCAIERIYVQRERFDEFVEALAAEAVKLRLGNPLDAATTLGPMVRASAADAVRTQVDEATARGATALVDPASFPAARSEGPYLAPQVLVGVDHSMALMAEETFGPVVGVMAVAGDDEAVALMNDSRYGLTASIWSQDVEAAEAIGDRLATGTVYLNGCDYLDPALAWTGVKDSGRGCSLSVLGFEALTRPKSFNLRSL
jgi:acyl-CoA reductase-like NAD-dependent aldehyde dehydrogenase